MLFEKCPELDSSDFRAVVDWEPLVDGSVDISIMQLKDLFIHAVVINQDNDWIFITQIEAYYKDKDVDDVATTSNLDEYPHEFTVKMEKLANERGGSWYELRFTYKKLEVIVTDVLDEIIIIITRV
ncbi:hypothetical protein RMATCC62417_00774 [Rhizopus microsporus]|nr:hypothetical protein RMATCC62417_00774 [Rhizopus microsporus]